MREISCPVMEINLSLLEWWKKLLCETRTYCNDKEETFKFVSVKTEKLLEFQVQHGYSVLLVGDLIVRNQQVVIDLTLEKKSEL